MMHGALCLQGVDVGRREVQAKLTTIAEAAKVISHSALAYLLSAMLLVSSIAKDMLLFG